MSQILIPGAFTYLPTAPFFNNSSGSTITLNATGETCFMVGHVVLENPLSSSKTISAAGSGKIVWVAGSVTFANGSSTFDIGIQDVSTASSPAQGDGTYDVKASLTGGGGGITASATNTTTMTTGTKTIANGDLIAITFAMTARGGADSVAVNTQAAAFAGVTTLSGLPAIVENTGGAYARNSTSIPLAYMVFDDGTLGWVYAAGFTPTFTTQAFNSGSATADEYGNLINYPFTFMALGIRVTILFAGNSSDLELLLYTDPLGTPAAVKTITVDATQIAATATAINNYYMFSSPYLIKANTNYGITARPTTANNITLYHRTVASVTEGKSVDIGTYNYAIRRLDNTGAFSDFNGGTAKTRQMSIGVFGNYIEQGTNMADGQVGVFNG